MKVKLSLSRRALRIGRFTASEESPGYYEASWAQPWLLRSAYISTLKMGAVSSYETSNEVPQN
jgi:hypothetical protein